jgi:hypothetical protein
LRPQIDRAKEHSKESHRREQAGDVISTAVLRIYKTAVLILDKTPGVFTGVEGRQQVYTRLL